MVWLHVAQVAVTCRAGASVTDSRLQVTLLLRLVLCLFAVLCLSIQLDAPTVMTVHARDIDVDLPKAVIVRVTVPHDCVVLPPPP